MVNRGPKIQIKNKNVFKEIIVFLLLNHILIDQ